MAFDPSKAVPVSGNGQTTPTRTGFNPSKAVPVREFVENNQAPVEKRQSAIDFSKPYQEEPSTGIGSAIVQSPVGAAETALTLGTGTLAPIVGLLAATGTTVKNAGRVVSNLLGGNSPYEDSAEAYTRMRNAATYEPRSESGKAATAFLSSAFEKTAGVPLNAVGKVLADAGMSPSGVEQTKDAILLGLPAVAGKGIKAIRANPTIAAKAGAVADAVKAPITSAATTAAEELGYMRDAAKMAADKTGVTAAAGIAKAVGTTAVEKMGKAGEAIKNAPMKSLAIPAALWATGLVDPSTAAMLGGVIQTGKMLRESSRAAQAAAALELDKGVMSTHRTAAKSSDAYAGLSDLADVPEVKALKAYNDAVAINKFVEFTQTAGKRLTEQQLKAHWVDVMKKGKIDPNTTMPYDFIETPARPENTKFYAGSDVSYFPASEITKMRKAAANSNQTTK